MADRELVGRNLLRFIVMQEEANLENQRQQLCLSEQ
jgi:hypothetical protein